MSDGSAPAPVHSPQLLFKRVTDPSQQTRFLFVGNCGPGVGMSEADLANLFEPVGPQSLVVPNPASTFVFAIFNTEQEAAQALAELEKRGPGQLGRKLVLRYSEAKPQPVPAPPNPVARTAEQLGVPGLSLLLDFVTEQEESDMLQAVQGGVWQHLAKRRVQHFGWEFDYSVRSFSRCLGPLPGWAQAVAERASQLASVSQPLDQLTVNEYTPGVGLSPHIDTHSAFTGAIVSLSLGSDCVMTLRCGEDARTLLLPRRSLLVLAGESRYAWQHYIPHRKVDDLGPEPLQGHGSGVPHGDTGLEASIGGRTPHQMVRGTRVSLTMRKVRGFPCDCAWPEHCDSRQGGPLPTRIAALLAQGDTPARGCMAVHTQADGDGPPTTQPAAVLEPPSNPTAPGRSQGPSQEADVHANGASPGIPRAEPGHTATPQGLDGMAAGGEPCQGPGEQQTQDLGHDTAHDRQGPGDGHDTAGNRQRTGNRHGAAVEHMGMHAGRIAAAGIGNGHSTDAEQAAEAVERAAEELESSHVHAVYDAIAAHFSDTRFAIWPKVRDFMTSLPPGAAVADVGCGNGKYFGVRSDIFVLGSDRSAGLAEVASHRLVPSAAAPLLLRADVLQADGLQLPYRDGSMDGVICIAVLHHVSSVARRRRMLGELLRVLRPGGRAIVTVWAAEQEDPKKTLDKWTRIAPIDPTGNAQDTPAPFTTGDPGTITTDGSMTSQQGPTSHPVPLGSPCSHPVHHVDLASHPVAAAGADGGEVACHPVQGEPNSHALAVGEVGSHPVECRSPVSHQLPGADVTSHQLPGADVASYAIAAGADAHANSTSSTGGGDYMVPWHLPMHRAAAKTAAAQPPAPAAPTQQQPQSLPADPSPSQGEPAAMSSSLSGSAAAPGSGSGSEAAPGSALSAPGAPTSSSPYTHLGPAKAKATSSVCKDKGTVVFQRYYHLFEAGELEGLVDSMPGCRRVDACFDRSNWCVVFERT